MNRIEWESPFAFRYAQMGERHDIAQWLRAEKVWNCEAGMTGVLQKSHTPGRSRKSREIQKKRLTARA